MLVGPEVEHQVHPVAVAEEVEHFFRRHVGLPQGHGVAPPPGQETAEIGQVAVLFGAHRLAPTFVFNEERHGIDAETGYSELKPEAHDALDLLAHGRVGEIQIWLKIVEAVEVVRARLAVVRPRRLLGAGEHDPALRVRRLAFGPHVPVAIRRCRIGPRRLEPWVLVRRVIDHQIDNDANAQLIRLANEIDEVAECAVARMNPVVVADVVAVIAHRRGVERHQPDTRDADAGEVREPVAQAPEVAHPIAVAIGKRADIEAIQDGVLVPEVDHRITTMSPYVTVC